MPSHSYITKSPLSGKALAGILLAIDTVVAGLFLAVAGITADAQEQPKPSVPPELLRRADVNLDWPYRVSGGKIFYQRPCWSIFPQNFDDTILPAGVLTKLKKHPEVTGLRLLTWKVSDVSSDTFLLDVTPGAIADIGRLSHLEHLSIRRVDLTRGDGLKFLKSLDRLRTLDFNECDVELHDVLAHLPTCKDLETLRVDHVPRQKSYEPATRRRVVTAQQIERLVKSSPKLQLIVLHSTERFEPEAIAQFAQLNALNILHVTYCWRIFHATDGLVNAKSPPDNARQQAEGQRLRELFEAKGMRKSGSAPRLKRHYRLPYHIIHVPNSSKSDASDVTRK